MRKVFYYLLLMMMSFSVFAESPGGDYADLRAAKNAFETAYATNDVETYFSFYAPDAKAYFGGAERGDIPAYHEMWSALMAAGGGVEINELSDIQFQVMPGGEVAVVTCFIDNHRREPDGSKVSAKAFQTDVWRKIDGQWKIISLHYSEYPEAE
jgi:ketosteroid isomerase-like protein